MMIKSVCVLQFYIFFLTAGHRILVFEVNLICTFMLKLRSGGIIYISILFWHACQSKYIVTFQCNRFLIIYDFVMDCFACFVGVWALPNISL